MSKWIIPLLFRLFICVFHSTSYKRNIPLYIFLLVYYFQYNTLLTHRYRKREKKLKGRRKKLAEVRVKRGALSKVVLFISFSVIIRNF